MLRKPALALISALLLSSSLAAWAQPTVQIKTNQGIIVVELNSEKAPNTVANFLQYVKDDFYSGTIFHRVISGFMIQGGGITKDFQEKPTRAPIKNEADNGLTNSLGTIAMARTGDPHSATAQFFINVANNQALNYTDKSERGWGYTVFGKVVKGLDVVQKISHVQTDGGDVPLQAVVIESVTVQ
ncbi:MAG TPA: peptidylprolyl isomerase [Methylophilaceae bacterium]|jgi:peptidyl-prolyl cis-trans isomerase A (cyclophilin A)/peptidyl-prolyl cis-trans isomerase B (cyclophilin B)